jgi:acetyl esterase
MKMEEVMQAPRFEPGRYKVGVSDVPYRSEDGHETLARVFRPDGGDGPFPAMVFVHGGAWSMGDRTGGSWVYEPLVASGMVVFSIDFGQAPEHPYPEPLTEINYAVRWAKAHAADFNAASDTLGIMGSSSGGHQAMLAAMRPDDSRYAALPFAEAPDVDARVSYVVGCWPILDPFARYLFAQETGRDELVTRTEGYFGSQEAMQEGNPQLILDRGEPTELPPLLILQGTADTNVRPEMQERFVKAYRARGADCEIEIFPDMPHGTQQWPEAETSRAQDAIRAFVARQIGTD